MVLDINKSTIGQFFAYPDVYIRLLQFQEHKSWIYSPESPGQNDTRRRISMIADSICNKDQYSGISPHLAQALDYVEGLKAGDFSEKTVELAGRQVYALHQAYITESAEGRQYEAHRRYIDVQYILEGEEVILAADLTNMASRSEYDEGKDIQWYMPKLGADAGADAGMASTIHLKAGQFAVFFPQDAHMPKLAAGSPGPVKKIVVKVAV
jgi:YhcH/YjgK/YiaL family protein